MANVDNNILLGKHLRAALTAISAKLNAKADANKILNVTEAQELTETEKQQARENIGASSFSGDFSDLTNNTAVLYTAQTLTEEQKGQVRANIGAGASSFSGNYSDLTNTPTKLSQFTNDSNFATTAEVSTAIANSKHASFEIVESIPDVSTAKDNILYLFKNSNTGYYDIYAKVNSAVERLDDVSVDLSQYSTTEQMNTAITTAINTASTGVLKSSEQTLSDSEKSQVLTNLGIEYASDSDVDTILTELGLTTTE